MRITTNRPSHLTSDEVAREVAEAQAAGREISDAAALTIASWWQSPAADGRAFAELSTTGSVDAEALRDNIVAVYAEAEAADRRALDMLGTWALYHPSLQPA